MRLAFVLLVYYLSRNNENEHRAKINFAGGRSLFDSQTQMRGLKYGFDASMIGDYLTIKGMDIKTDIINLKNSGFLE